MRRRVEDRYQPPLPAQCVCVCVCDGNCRSLLAAFIIRLPWRHGHRRIHTPRLLQRPGSINCLHLHDAHIRRRLPGGEALPEPERTRNVQLLLRLDAAAVIAAQIMAPVSAQVVAQQWKGTSTFSICFVFLFIFPVQSFIDN